ncbi:hypothetical protein ABZ341_18360 [Streptomyces sp. NPDC006173]|uniref:hypothetical protein n=1 Tax=Streptomyces sp. NPDC006173 TaxID=3155349 RepID=UPI0033C4F6EB
MIRTIYKGRPIKVLSVRGKPLQRRLIINGHAVHHGWEGTDEQGLAWFKQIIDGIESNGGAGIVATSRYFYGQYTQPHWYEPGAIDINPNGHATQPGGLCLCNRCTTTDKSWFSPLPLDACRNCHQTPDSHKNDWDLMNTHSYRKPTEKQTFGRQLSIDKYKRLTSYDEDEAA